MRPSELDLLCINGVFFIFDANTFGLVVFVKALDTVRLSILCLINVIDQLCRLYSSHELLDNKILYKKGVH